MKAVLAFIIGLLFLLLSGIALDRIREELDERAEHMVLSIAWYVVVACAYAYTSYSYLVEAYVLGTS